MSIVQLSHTHSLTCEWNRLLYSFFFLFTSLLPFNLGGPCKCTLVTKFLSFFTLCLSIQFRIKVSTRHASSHAFPISLSLLSNPLAKTCSPFSFLRNNNALVCATSVLIGISLSLFLVQVNGMSHSMSITSDRLHFINVDWDVWRVEPFISSYKVNAQQRKRDTITLTHTHTPIDWFVSGAEKYFFLAFFLFFFLLASSSRSHYQPTYSVIHFTPVKFNRASLYSCQVTILPRVRFITISFSPLCAYLFCATSSKSFIAIACFPLLSCVVFSFLLSSSQPSLSFPFIRHSSSLMSNGCDLSSRCILQ